MQKKTIDKYLINYAEQEVNFLEKFPNESKYQNTLIIPAYNEYETIIKLLKNFPEINSENTLVILIVNAPENSPSNALKINKKLVAYLKQNFPNTWSANKSINLLQFPFGDLLLVEKTLPEKTGVGLARKIVADMALYLIHKQRITTAIIHNTDSDVILPQDYFAQTKNVTEHAAIIYNFEHQVDRETKEGTALWLYDVSLQHYVKGLAYAGSPYAYHTIGSTIAINAEAYAKVRGFPKREAGEDFYLLNKLAKVGSIHQLQANPIIITNRVSDRVPFGTGAAVQKILGLDAPGNDYQFYHPNIFVYLKYLLDCFSALHRKEDLQQRLFNRVPTGEFQEILPVLEQLGAFAAISKLQSQANTEAQFQKQLHTWFDGFRTLKFVHGLRDNSLGTVNLKQMLECLPYQLEVML